MGVCVCMCVCVHLYIYICMCYPYLGGGWRRGYCFSAAHQCPCSCWFVCPAERLGLDREPRAVEVRDVDPLEVFLIRRPNNDLPLLLKGHADTEWCLAFTRYSFTPKLSCTSQ